MKRLGYAKFAAQGGDWGGAVVNTMAQQAPPELLGFHTNFPATIPADILRSLNASDPAPASLTVDERRAYGELATLFAKKRAYAAYMGTRPQTLYGLADSPVDLAAWMVDHGDGWAQPAAAVSSAILGRTVNGHPAGALTLDDLLDNITLYWLTNTGVSSSRLYWETHTNLYAAIDVSVPAAITVFPGENYEAPRSWTERAYRNLVYFHQVDRGGHFAAWEQPQLFSEEVRAGLRSLRT
jgi:pimeloyl-ACP methyl ester carboxylesterase